MSESWSARLNRCFNDGQTPRRQVRLPNHPDLTIGGSGDTVSMHLRGAAVAGNMQTNAAAFESWALALHRWCGVHVVISWDEPDPDLVKTGSSASGHYQRFLYRLANFADLFAGDWLTIVDEGNAVARRLTRDGTSLYVNQGGAKPKALPAGDLHHDKWSEDRWECHLADNDVRWLDDEFGGFDKKVQQFPVGLFSEPKPSKPSSIFPGAKSAIDIIAQISSTIWIFELKKSGNVGFGALSELLFYTWFVRDVADGRFKQAESDAKSRIDFQIPVGDPKQAIQGVLLAPKIHPLIEDGVFKLLNDALANRPGRKIAFESACFEPSLWSQAARS